MRRFILPAATLLVLAVAAPAMASAGLPKIASLNVGGHTVAVHADSPSAKTGTNTFTVEVSSLPAGHTVHFSLVGPQGQVVEVPLRDLLVLDGPDGGHGDGTDAHGTASHDGGHEDSSTGHDASPVTPGVSPSHDGHGDGSTGHDHATSGDGASPNLHETASHGETAPQGETVSHVETQAYSARGKAVLDTPGTWQVVVQISGDHTDPLTARAPIEVHPGGPAPGYVGFTGLTMGGFLTYGVFRRRGRASGGR